MPRSIQDIHHLVIGQSEVDCDAALVGHTEGSGNLGLGQRARTQPTAHCAGGLHRGERSAFDLAVALASPTVKRLALPDHCAGVHRPHAADLDG